MQIPKVGPLDKARIVFAARKLFLRERVPTKTRVDAVLAYYYGMSFRSTSRYHEGAFCAESARRWWHRLGALFNTLRGPHGVVVADETWLHMGKRTHHVTRLRYKGRGAMPRPRIEEKRVPASHLMWASIDAKTMELVNLLVGRHTTNVDCRAFLEGTRDRSRTRPTVIHDRGGWYRSQCPALDLPHVTMRGGVRSRIECWFRQLKHRLDRFWRAFPDNASDHSIESWLRAYAVCWNFTRDTP